MRISRCNDFQTALLFPFNLSTNQMSDGKVSPGLLGIIRTIQKIKLLCNFLLTFVIGCDITDAGEKAQ